MNERIYLIPPAVFAPITLTVAAIVACFFVSWWFLAALPFIWLGSICAAPNLIHAPVLALPRIVGRLTDVVLGTHRFHGRAAVSFPQDPDHLLFAVSASFHFVLFSLLPNRTSFFNCPVQGGQATEILPDEKHGNVEIFLKKALSYFASLGIKVERLMSDNGAAYRSRPIASFLRSKGIRHIFTKPYTPRPTARPSASSRPL